MRECVNCKYSRGLGSDVWCDHNPKGEESYMTETTCIYYEPVETIQEKIDGLTLTMTREENISEKRFTDNGLEAIEDQSFTDNLTKKTYYVDYFDEVVDLCNSLWEQTKRFEKHNKDLMKENEQLRQQLQSILKLTRKIEDCTHDIKVIGDLE